MLKDNELSGPLPLLKSFASQKLASFDVSSNLLTGNATQYVEVFGEAHFIYNCFDPAVTPNNQGCGHAK